MKLIHKRWLQSHSLASEGTKVEAKPLRVSSRRSWLFGLVTTASLHLVLWVLPMSLSVQAQKRSPKMPLILRFATAPQAQKTKAAKPVRRRRTVPKRQRYKKKRRYRRRRVRRRRSRRRKVMKRRVHVVKKRSIVPAARPKPPQPPAASKPPAPLVHQTKSRKVAMARATVARDVPRSSPRPVVVKKKRVTVDFGAYKRGLFHSIARRKRYPFMARRMGQEGSVVVLVKVSRQGTLASTPKLLRSSRFSSLDREALRMVRAVFPWKALPSGYQGGNKSFRIVVRFTLDD